MYIRSIILALVVFILGLRVEIVQSAVIFSENWDDVTEGDIVGRFGVGHNQVALDLVAKNWFVNTGCWSTTGFSGSGPLGYCAGSIISKLGPTGVTTKVLRFRYEEGPASNSADSGMEIRLGKEDGFGNNPLTGGYPEIWTRHYLRYEPVPSNTPSCTPNCPVPSNTNVSSEKHHYWKDLMTGPGAVNPVMGGFQGSSVLGIGPQSSQDCPFVGGVYDCPTLYGSIPINDNQWYCIESHIKSNSVGQANGAFEMWVNGVQSLNSQGRILQTNIVNRINQMLIYRQSGGYRWRFEDEFVVGTTRVGCIGSAPPPDTTPPFDVPSITVSPGITFLDVSWPAVTDNPSGFVTYNLEFCTGVNCTSWGTPVTVNATNYTVSALAPETTMRFRVKAKDGANLLSTNWSPIGSGTVPAADTTAPSKPSSLTVR